jgi:hypothetical protein
MQVIIRNPENELLDEFDMPTMAAKYRVSDISLGRAKEFFTHHHYAKGCGTAPTAAYGLFEGDWLIGALMFQRPGSEATCKAVFGEGFEKSVTGLHRLAILDVTPKNTESWFIARCLARLKRDRPIYHSVLTFADPSAGHTGTIYRASNALYYGMSKREMRYATPDGGRRTRRQCGRNIPVEEALARGWEVAYDPPKFRYCFVLGRNKFHRRDLFSSLRLKAVPFPKGGVTANGFKEII